MKERINHLSVDCCIFGYSEKGLNLLLIKRNKEPEKGRWCFPGGYVNQNEDIDDSAGRLLYSLTGIKDVFMTQVKAFGSVDRYPDVRVISILYCAILRPEYFNLIAGNYAKEAEWFDLNEIEAMPFDHDLMLSEALMWLKDQIVKGKQLQYLLPQKFPLNLMQEIYERLLNKNYDNRNFRKKMVDDGVVIRLDEKTKGGRQRPAFLYKLASD